MNRRNTKQWIRELADEYYREAYPNQPNELEKTWRAFDELELLDQGGIELREAEAPATVGASGDLVETVVSAIVLGVITNAVYDTLKWSAKQVRKAIADRKWQEKFINRMGKLKDKVRDKALHVLLWALERILRNKLEQ